MAGYHKREIVKGKLGELSKIQEELDELKDADEQGCRIMALVELADLLGAIRHYMRVHHPGFRMSDLKKMASITGKAFEHGGR